MNDVRPIDIAHTPLAPDPAFDLQRSRKRRGDGLPLHVHDKAQLTFAASGALQIYTAEGRWLVPPQLAVWTPAGLPHRIEFLTDAELWILHRRASATEAREPIRRLDRAFALRVTPLLQALLVAAFETDIALRKAELVVELMLHELTETADAPTFLPLPASAVARRVADLALDDARHRLDIGELASRAATSVRTISRLFPQETGLTFKAWRQRARIVRVMDRLAGGDPIARVATDCGFASTAAFSCAFRQVTALTPTTFLTGPPPR